MGRKDGQVWWGLHSISSEPRTSSLRHTTNSHWLSILRMIVYMCRDTVSIHPILSFQSPSYPMLCIFANEAFWNTATRVHLCPVCNCLHAAMAGLRIYDRDLVTDKAKKKFTVWPLEKKFAAPCYRASSSQVSLLFCLLTSVAYSHLSFVGKALGD